MVKMFTQDPFSNFIYKKHLESIVARFKRETRIPCYSVGKFTSGCNRRNFYSIKDMFDNIEPDLDKESVVRMTTGQIYHDSFILSPKPEWHLVYNEIYGHVDEYFSDVKVLVEKKTTMQDIPGWKQTLNKDKNGFLYLPGEEWENQLRYYYLLISRGDDVETGKPVNPTGEPMVRHVYVLYYTPSVEDILQPYIIPVSMEKETWTLNYIESELFSKKDEVEKCMKEHILPNRRVSPYKCPECPYLVRCFFEDKETKDELPEEVRVALGKRSIKAKAQELTG